MEYSWKFIFSFLILDSGGSPTTITVLSDEYLTVIYSYRIYGILADSTGSVTFTGDLGGTYDYKIRHGHLSTGLYTTSTGYFPKAVMNQSYFYRYQYIYPNLAYDDVIGAINEDPTGTSVSIGFTTVDYTPGTYTSNVKSQ